MSPGQAPSASLSMTPNRRTAREILIEQLYKPSMTVLNRAYPLQCDQCGMSFIRRVHLNAHTRLHQDKGDITCPVCDSRFHNSLSLQDHLEKAHPPNRAFNVSYSIAERISYVPPEQFTVSVAVAEAPVSPPEDVPDDFGYQSAFQSVNKKRCRRTSDSSEPKPKRNLVEKTPVSLLAPFKMSILQSLLTGNGATRPPVVFSNAPAMPPVVINPLARTVASEYPEHVAFDRQDIVVKSGSSYTPSSNGYSSDSSGSCTTDYSDGRNGQFAKDVSCEHCGKRFLYKCNLARHLSAIHNERTLKTDSSTAGRSPRAPFKVGPTEMIPTEKKAIVLLRCKFCERSFTQKSSLVLHQQVHQGEEPYRCTICHGLKFGSIAQWQAHMDRHRMRAAKQKRKHEQQLEQLQRTSSPMNESMTILCVD